MCQIFSSKAKKILRQKLVFRIVTSNQRLWRPNIYILELSKILNAILKKWIKSPLLSDEIWCAAVQITFVVLYRLFTLNARLEERRKLRNFVYYKRFPVTRFFSELICFLTENLKNTFGNKGNKQNCV